MVKLSTSVTLKELRSPPVSGREKLIMSARMIRILGSISVMKGLRYLMLRATCRHRTSVRYWCVHTDSSPWELECCSIICHQCPQQTKKYVIISLHQGIATITDHFWGKKAAFLRLSPTLCWTYCKYKDVGEFTPPSGKPWKLQTSDLGISEHMQPTFSVWFFIYFFAVSFWCMIRWLHNYSQAFMNAPGCNSGHLFGSGRSRSRSASLHGYHQPSSGCPAPAQCHTLKTDFTVKRCIFSRKAKSLPFSLGSFCFVTVSIINLAMLTGQMASPSLVQAWMATGQASKANG